MRSFERKMLLLLLFLSKSIFSESDDHNAQPDLSPDPFLNLHSPLHSRENKDREDYVRMVYFHDVVFKLFRKSRSKEDCATKYQILDQATFVLSNTNFSSWNKEALLVGKINLGDQAATLADEIITGEPFCFDEFRLFCREVGMIKTKEAMRLLNDYAAIFASKCENKNLEIALISGKNVIFLEKIIINKARMFLTRNIRIPILKFLLLFELSNHARIKSSQMSSRLCIVSGKQERCFSRIHMDATCSTTLLAYALCIPLAIMKENSTLISDFSFWLTLESRGDCWFL